MVQEFYQDEDEDDWFNIAQYASAAGASDGPKHSHRDEVAAHVVYATSDRDARKKKKSHAAHRELRRKQEDSECPFEHGGKPCVRDRRVHAQERHRTQNRQSGREVRNHPPRNDDPAPFPPRHSPSIAMGNSGRSKYPRKSLDHGLEAIRDKYRNTDHRGAEPQFGSRWRRGYSRVT